MRLLWIVQCGNFSTRWKAGEILHVDFQNEEGRFLTSTEIELTYAPFDKSEDITIETRYNQPKCFAMSQNYPNPFNTETNIKYQIPETCRVIIRIYNILGQEVITLLDEMMEAGYYELTWDGKNNFTTHVGSGMYLVQLSAEDFHKIIKILLIR